MILLSLASKQIWPHVLSVAHLAPEQVFLLHSEDAVESKGPAQRLKRFFDASGLVPRGATYLEAVLHDDFSAIESRFDEIIAKHRLNLAECLVNFTGGNKLMSSPPMTPPPGAPENSMTYARLRKTPPPPNSFWMRSDD